MKPAPEKLTDEKRDSKHVAPEVAHPARDKPASSPATSRSTPATKEDKEDEKKLLKPMPENELNKIGTHVYNKGKYGNIPDHQQLSTSDKQLLQNTFEPYNKALLKLLQWKKTDWVH